MNTTAIVLSSRPYLRQWEGLRVLVSIQRIETAEQFNDARVSAIRLVTTPHFFFLDDDDDLPADYLEVLEACIEQQAAVAYTDRLVDGELVKSAPYSQQAHLRDPRLVHQLAVYDSRLAQHALHQLPRGPYYPELALAWEMAKHSAAYVPRVGYHWNRRGGQLHTWPQVSIAQTRTKLWCKGNP